MMPKLRICTRRYPRLIPIASKVVSPLPDFAPA
jgi:hypothetical protein